MIQRVTENNRTKTQDQNLCAPDAVLPSAGNLQSKREQMRRFADQFRNLPIETNATCPNCNEVVPAKFERIGEQVVLQFNCITPRCTPQGVVHHDVIWTQTTSEWKDSKTHTYLGTRIRPALRRLPIVDLSG